MLDYFAQSRSLNETLLTKNEAHGDKLFWLASLTKIITSFVALQLVDEGKIGLDTPLNKHLPQLDTVQILKNGVLIPRQKDITLRMLLTHTSGFGYDTWNADLGKYMKDNHIWSIQSCKIAALDVPLVAEPSTKFIYGTSIDFVGFLIEKLTNQTLFEAMQARLFKPLNMASFTFILSESQKQNRFPMMMEKAQDVFEPMNFITADPQELNMGGGGLWGSPYDYMKFLLMLLGGAKGFLSPALFQQAITNQIGAFEVGFDTPVSLRATQPYELVEGAVKKWGLLAMINETPTREGRSEGSIAWCGLANCFYWLDFKRGIAGLFATQLFPFAQRQAILAFEEFERESYAAR